MGTGRVNQKDIRGSIIMLVPKGDTSKKKLKSEISKSICKILATKILGTGFLIKFPKEGKVFYCLMSCGHVITNKLIKQKEKISFLYDDENKIKNLILDQNQRYIKNFKEIKIDATIVEILSSDKIDENYFLSPNIDYMDNLNRLNNEKIKIPQFPKGGSLTFSKGEITKVDKNEFIHNAKCEKGSSGSPLLLKGSNEVIGLHKAENPKIKEYYADSIGRVFDFIRKGFKYITEEDFELIHILQEIKDSDIRILNQFFNYKPIILKIHSQNGLVEIDDKGNRKTQFLLSNENMGLNYCGECEKLMKTFYYCIKCKKYFCSNCLNYNHATHLDLVLPLNICNNICLIHKNKIIKYCLDCQKNICEICENKYHLNHMKEKINNSNVLDAKKKVLQKIQKLNQMKKFYEMVNFSYESNHHNSIYKRNVINVAKSIKTEKKFG